MCLIAHLVNLYDCVSEHRLRMRTSFVDLISLASHVTMIQCKTRPHALIAAALLPVGLRIEVSIPMYGR